MITIKRQKCAECGYKYPPDENVDRYAIGREMVYLATKAADEPWYCPEHRASQ